MIVKSPVTSVRDKPNLTRDALSATGGPRKQRIFDERSDAAVDVSHHRAVRAGGEPDLQASSAFGEFEEIRTADAGRAEVRESAAAICLRNVGPGPRHPILRRGKALRKGLRALDGRPLERARIRCGPRKGRDYEGEAEELFHFDTI